MTIETPDPTRNFKSLFCSRFECPAASFEKKLFYKAIHPDLRPFAFLMRCFRPKFFRRDFEAIRSIGAATNAREFMTVVNALQFDPRFNGGFLRGFVRMRISVKRLTDIADSML